MLPTSTLSHRGYRRRHDVAHAHHAPATNETSTSTRLIKLSCNETYAAR